MSATGLIEDCYNCLLREQKTWKSYFSKWEVLAKKEEKIPEEELTEKVNRNIFQKTKQIKKQTKRPGKVNSSKSAAIKKAVKTNKSKKKLLAKSKKSRKRRHSEKIVRQSTSASNENLPDNLDNELVEVDLKAVIANILKANKNKWEIFSVLSQTFSQNVIQKGSHCLVFNQSPELPSNNLLSTVGDQVLSLKNASGFREKKFGETISFHLDGRFGDFKFLNSDRQYRADIIINQRFGNQSFKCAEDKQESCLLPVKAAFGVRKNPLPNFTMRHEILKSFPSENSFMSSPWNNFSLERIPIFKALEFGKQSKINNERVRTGFQEDLSRWENSQNVCLHKGASYISFNMENSNFVSPKRKPSDRKCFSENILPRKRRCLPTRPGFFHIEEESESDDDKNLYRSPVIRWHEEEAKTEEKSLEKKKEDDLDWDQCGSVFDRNKKT